jgi:PAS domain-containing protein
MSDPRQQPLKTDRLSLPLGEIGEMRELDAAKESESRFRALVSATWDVVYRMSPDWAEMRFLLGREFISDTDEPIRTWLDKYIHPDDQPRVTQAIRDAINSKSAFELEHRVLRADGSLAWTQSRAVPLLDPSGEIVEWFGTASDVTARKLAEEREAFVRQASGVGFWYCDLPFDVLVWDDLVKAHFHLPSDATVTIDTFYDRMHPDDREPTRRAIEQSIADRTAYDTQYRTVDPASGAVKWIRAIGANRLRCQRDANSVRRRDARRDSAARSRTSSTRE